MYIGHDRCGWHGKCAKFEGYGKVARTIQGVVAPLLVDSQLRLKLKVLDVDQPEL